MRMGVRSLLMIWAILGLVLTPAVAGPNTVSKPHVTATLLADRDAVAPGQKFRIAIEFRIDEHWHMYWISGGEPDAPANPTHVTLKAPDGFQASPPRFPPPRILRSDVGVMYVLEDKAVVLFDVQAPAQLGGPSVTFKVDADWLVCKESCLLGDASLEITLPVAKSAGETKASNGRLFKAAVAALPIAAERASYVKVAAQMTQDRVRPGDKFDIQLLIDVRKEHHIQAADTQVEGLIATQVFIEPALGLELTAKPKYPPGKTRVDKLLGTLSEYTDRVVITLPFEAGDTLEGNRTPVRGVLRYQACVDSGTCFPPEDVQFAFDVPLARSSDKVLHATTALAKPQDGLLGPVAPPDQTKPAVGSTKDVGSKEGNSLSNASDSDVDFLTRFSTALEKLGIFGYLILAFLGGMLVNVMPCVLPVISLKVLSFVKQAQEHRLRIFLLGLTFSAGILISFAVLGGLMLLANQSWGGLFQYPQVIIGLAALVTAFALSLFGVFTLSPPAAIDQLGAKASGEGFGHALAMGILATVLGTACTAPLLSGVVAIAVQKPPMTGFAIFLTAGFGMALPYVVLTANPIWLRFIPRSGPWMKTFEQVMGFLLLGTVIWLMYPLPAQITGKGMVWALVFILFVSFAAWLYGRVQFGDSLRRRMRYYSTALCFVVIGWLLPFEIMNTIPDLQKAAIAERLGQYQDGELTARDFEKEVPWRPYTRQRALDKARAGYTVFVDFTADWCVNCKINERSSIDINATRELMAQSGVIPLKADYTNKDPDITRDLLALGRSGVPTVVVYPAGKPDSPIVLPVVLTPGIVRDALKQAGPSTVRAKPERLAQRTPGD